jgi:uncharacterized protein
MRLAAGGSLEPAIETGQLSRRVRAWLIVEMLALYIGAPLAIYYAVFTLGFPLFIAMQPVLLGFLVYLLWDGTFHMRRELSQGFAWGQLGQIIAKFLIVGGAIAWATYVFLPGRFLAFPRYAPELWMMVMVLYPVLSVIAQELVYRTFFFHRYGILFDGCAWLAILVNGILFGFAHIIFGNIVAVVGTAFIGLLLAYRYARTRSFWAVWLEHTLYGWLVFTVGLGRFFFTGVSNLN